MAQKTQIHLKNFLSLTFILDLSYIRNSRVLANILGLTVFMLLPHSLPTLLVKPLRLGEPSNFLWKQTTIQHFVGMACCNLKTCSEIAFALSVFHQSFSLLVGMFFIFFACLLFFFFATIIIEDQCICKSFITAKSCRKCNY